MNMWSSLTLRRSKDKSKEKITAVGDNKKHEATNQKLTRAATFCYPPNYKCDKNKKSWLINLPKVRRRFIKHKSDKIQTKSDNSNCKQEQEKAVRSFGKLETLGNEDLAKSLDNIR